MKYISRKPDFYVEIKRPNYNSSVFHPNYIEPIGVFGPEEKDSAFVGYEFNETLQITNTSFRLLFTPIADDDGLTWFDKIHITDIVTIKEMGITKFVGIVTDRRYSSRMTGEGASRNIFISGTSIGNLLSRFILTLDLHLYDTDTFAEVQNLSLKVGLTQKMKSGNVVAPILEKIYSAFFDLATKMGQINKAGVGIKSLLDYYVDFSSDLSDDIVLRYPISLSIFNVGDNNIWSILSNLVGPPINELFPQFDSSDGKYHVVFRQAPFEPDDWKKLKLNRLAPLIITDCDFGSNDSEVYTYYLAILAGSGRDEKRAMVMDADGPAKMVVRDEEKWKKYGYKPLIIQFKYFDREKWDEMSSLTTTMLNLSSMMQRWFEHNDEFLSGSIEFMTIDDNWWPGYIQQPQLGERMRFLEGEFYIEEITHSWQYDGSMVSRINISRGYVYNPSGDMIEPILNPGRKADVILRKNIENRSETYQKRYIGI